MEKYLIRFTTESDEYDKEWCYANDELEAAEIIQHEHWNIKSIDNVSRI